MFGGTLNFWGTQQQGSTNTAIKSGEDEPSPYPACRLPRAEEVISVRNRMLD